MKKIFLILLILFSLEFYSQQILKFSHGEFEFCLTKECGENDCEIIKIEVFKDGYLKQTITPSENYFSKTFPNDQLFAIEDMNFDGKIDFRLIEFLPAGPSVPFLFWIYNKTSKRFERNRAYEEIGSPEFDYKKKQINSLWRNGCCEHGNDVYKLINGVPKLTERFVIGHNSEGKEYDEYWKFENGKLKLIEKTVD